MITKGIRVKYVGEHCPNDGTIYTVTAVQGCTAATTYVNDAGKVVVSGHFNVGALQPVPVMSWRDNPWASDVTVCSLAAQLDWLAIDTELPPPMLVDAVRDAQTLVEFFTSLPANTQKPGVIRDLKKFIKAYK